MNYCTQADLEVKIPAPYLLDALDDDGDRAIDADVLAGLLDGASREVDAILGQRYATPFAEPVPSICRQAAIFFACRDTYARRGIAAEENPWQKTAGEWTKKLDRIAAGDEPLTPEKQRSKPSGSIISEDSKVHSPQNLT